MNSVEEDDDIPGIVSRIFRFHDRIMAAQRGRFLGFLLSGWVGFLLAQVSLEFDGLGDLLAIDDYSFRHLSETIANPFMVIFWPLASLLTPPWAVLQVLFLLALSVAALVYLSTPEPSPLWLIGFAAYGSLVPLISDRTPLFAFVLASFFCLGLGALGWQVIQVKHAEFVERCGRLLRGESEPGPPDE